MSQTKYKMPQYLRQAVVWLCRGYEDMKEWYDEEYSGITTENGTIDGIPRGTQISNPTEKKAVGLLELNNHCKTKIMTAIEQAKVAIGDDLRDEALRSDLTSAIWESTLDGRNYPFEAWSIPTIYRDDFYERKRAFIWSVAKNIGLL